MCGSLISSIAYVMIFYFSGTGNSRWVSEQLSTAGAEELVAIADVYASDRRFVLRPDEKVGFVFPVYSWGPPSIVLQLIASVQFSEKPAYLYFVCTCGDDTGKTAEIFCKAVGRRGWKCQAGFSVIMPNTYVCLPGFDIDWRDVAETKCQEAEVRVAEIARLVAERVPDGLLSGAVPGLEVLSPPAAVQPFLVFSPAVPRGRHLCLLRPV